MADHKAIKSSRQGGHSIDLDINQHCLPTLEGQPPHPRTRNRQLGLDSCIKEACQTKCTGSLSFGARHARNPGPFSPWSHGPPPAAARSQRPSETPAAPSTARTPPAPLPAPCPLPPPHPAAPQNRRRRHRRTGIAEIGQADHAREKAQLLGDWFRRV